MEGSTSGERDGSVGVGEGKGGDVGGSEDALSGSGGEPQCSSLERLICEG